MTDTTQSKVNRDDDPDEREETRRQAPGEQPDRDNPPAQRSSASASGQRTSPGRKPLFGT
jgi:hypothetical protein